MVATIIKLTVTVKLVFKNVNSGKDFDAEVE